MVPPDTKYAKSGRYHIAYQVFGEGAFDLVMIPGFVSHLEMWWEEPITARGLRRLASFARIIIFDKRGTGMSDRVNDAELPTPEERMDDVRAVMDAAGSDSTARAAQLGDRRWKSLLDEHDTLVDQQLAAYRGKRVHSIGLGDGVLATFDGPARAIRCAEAICRGLRSLGLDVRAGVHTGEVELRGEDLSGMAVHIGARVSALAGAGEVLVSGSVPPLVAGSGITFEDRGERELKGVPGPWRLFAVIASPKG